MDITRGNMSWEDHARVVRGRQPPCHEYTELSKKIRLASISHRREDKVPEVRQQRKALLQRLLSQARDHTARCRPCQRLSGRQPTNIFFELLGRLPAAPVNEAVINTPSTDFDLEDEIRKRAFMFHSSDPARARQLNINVTEHIKDRDTLDKWWSDTLVTSHNPRVPNRPDALHLDQVRYNVRLVCVFMLCFRLSRISVEKTRIS